MRLTVSSIDVFILSIFVLPIASGQTVTSSLPAYVNASQCYLFYLHGGIVQEQGINAVSKEYGPYKYLNILDSLRSLGYNVISEARPRGTDVEEYGKYVARQIDTLLGRGLPPEHIIVVGASLGAYITIETSHILKNESVRYVVMGLCNEYNMKYYAKYKDDLCGNFLSIYEATDQKLSCDELLEDLRCKSGYREVRLTMGNGHGFLYKPYGEWLVPLDMWIKGKTR
jgi:hypothetical protein